MPKIVQYNLPPGGTVVQVADNTSEALDIETINADGSTDDYIVVDTTDTSESVTIKASSHGVKVTDSGAFLSTKSQCWSLLAEDASATNPNILPVSGDGDTGIGRAAADQLSLVSGGVEIARAIQHDSGSFAGVLAVGTDIADIAAASAASLHVRNDSVGTQACFQRDSGQLLIEMSGANSTLNSNVDFRVQVGAGVDFFIESSNGYAGIGTSTPSQILDCNSGSGNIIADGYDTHSLAAYKENIDVAGAGYLAKVLACQPKQWTRIPHVSAEEIKTAAIEQFGQNAWDSYFPEDDSHRGGALLEMPEGEMKSWINAFADAKREERRQEEKWQRVNLGLVADAEDTASSFSESIAKNDAGEISGINTMSYIGTLHAAIIELAAKVAELEAGG